MKKLNIAILGQGRSGKNIHGAYYVSKANTYYNIKYVVDADEFRRGVAKKLFPDATVYADYKELFDKKDIDIVVNALYSEFHYPVTKDLLEHGFNVLCEKPFARTTYECEDLIKTAKDNGVLLAVFQQTFYAPYFIDALNIAESGKLGEIEQVSIRFNCFKRRWDWQTLQRKVAGGIYNTGPHPIGIALAFLGFDKDTKIEYSKLACTPLCSGDSDDYAKIIFSAPGKPVVDLEVSNIDAFCDFNIYLQGTKGTLKNTPSNYKMKYIVDGENPPQPLKDTFLADKNGEPMYCGEQFITHDEEGPYLADAFDAGTAGLYEDLYYALTEGRPMKVTAEMASKIINVIEEVHAQNPLERKF